MTRASWAQIKDRQKNTTEAAAHTWNNSAKKTREFAKKIKRKIKREHNPAAGTLLLPLWEYQEEEKKKKRAIPIKAEWEITETSGHDLYSISANRTNGWWQQ